MNDRINYYSSDKLQFFKDVIHNYWDLLPDEMKEDINAWYEKTKEDQA
tara:strand:- start:145 stop:288 length:144 start_codon:yes stop_codon:yes gene_type:complete